MTQQQLTEALASTARIKYFINLNRKLKPWEYFERQEHQDKLNELKVELPKST